MPCNCAWLWKDYGVFLINQNSEKELWMFRELRQNGLSMKLERGKITFNGNIDNIRQKVAY